MLEAHYIAPRSIRCGGFFLFWGQGFWQKDEVLIPSPTGGTLKESGSDGIIPPMQHAGEASKPASHRAPTAHVPRCSTQRAGIAPPHAEGDGLSGVASDGELYGFISVPVSFVGGVPVTRAMNPWAMPEASV